MPSEEHQKSLNKLRSLEMVISIELRYIFHDKVIENNQAY
jgi:hypothetical protein